MQIEGWSRDGLTNEQLAANMGVTVKTFYEWQARFVEFREAIKRGKAPVDIQVENALLKSALGHTVKVKKPIKIKEIRQKVGEGRIETERIEYADEEVYIPPNSVAQIFWLKNRRPDKWRDKPDANSMDNEPVKVVFDV